MNQQKTRAATAVLIMHLPLVEQHGRCVMPDLPLRAHKTPLNGADLSPPGLAAMLAELIERQQLTEVTVVGNDTGGALCQIVR